MASSGTSNVEEDMETNNPKLHKIFPAHHHHDHDLHPHFLVQDPVEDDLSAHDSQILIDPVEGGKMNVRLGFLQVKHVYEVRFSIQHNLGKDIDFDPLENLNAKIESATPSDDGSGHDITLTFNAVKEKIMKESITIKSKDAAANALTLVLQARVLGKGKGTPSLKKGIHCVRIEWDEESEGSDWQGH